MVLEGPGTNGPGMGGPGIGGPGINVGGRAGGGKNGMKRVPGPVGPVRRFNRIRRTLNSPLGPKTWPFFASLFFTALRLFLLPGVPGVPVLGINGGKKGAGGAGAGMAGPGIKGPGIEGPGTSAPGIVR